MYQTVELEFCLLLHGRQKLSFRSWVIIEGVEIYQKTVTYL